MTQWARWVSNEPQPMQPEEWETVVMDFDGFDESKCESERFWREFCYRINRVYIDG